MRYAIRGMMVAATIGLAAGTAGAEDKKPAAKPGQVEAVEASKLSEATKTCGRAATVNFVKELGVPLDYLGRIGVEIAQARKAADPVCLALAAKSLAVAEAVAGKKASVTSEEVMKEAVALAEMRAISTELKAMDKLVTDAGTKDKLSQVCQAAERREADARAATKSGERTRAINGTLTVANTTDECLRVYVDGRYVGEVHAGQTAGFHVHNHNHRNVLEAYCEDGGELVSRSSFHGDTNNLYWPINK